ncbi:caudovirus prohead protease, putative [Brevundimonas sp. BAL3]|uniref:prohead protease/major capsid protein fusion protein n=1 Tax=Brevundimonas sp. BAL3 TaxID=391600 RepID=UPI00017ED50C|nr:prohead protease/major capsid protein fusion protein [Brevundimonas sp. BAL3]EDX82120.1 caudovirus prohead protease, putative [Brevundimonas sp. BAL3]
MTMTAVTAAALLAVQPMMTRDAGAGVETRNAPPATRQVRDAAFRPATYDAASRTVELVLSVGAAVARYGFVEELEITAAAIDLSRVGRGVVPLLNTHSRWSIGDILGTVVSARVESVDGVPALVATARFAETEAGREAEGMVQRGELRGVSIGYDVKVWTVVQIDEETGVHTWRATAWELLEASLVPVPADPSAGVRSAADPSPATPNPGAPANSQEDEDMRRSLIGGMAALAFGGAVAVLDPNAAERGLPAAPAAPAVPAEPAAAPEARAAPAPVPAPAAPAAPSVEAVRFSGVDAVAFVDMARSLGVETRASELVAQNGRGEIGVEAARDALLRAAAERQRADTAPVASGSAARAGDNDQVRTQGLIVEALVARATHSQPSEGARQFMNVPMLELAAERAGLARTERDPHTILRAAHTTSDFPIILESVGQRIVQRRYEVRPATYQAIARRRDLRDFRPTKLLTVGDFPTLLAYQEDGEIKSGTINEGKESVVLGSYGRIVRITRQMIVNDDLGVFDEVFGTIGRTVRNFENATAWAVKNLNSGLGPKMSDGKTFFHADHGNLAASGAAPSITTLGAARAKMMVQKDIDGNIMNLMPSTFLVGADLLTVAEQLTSSIQPVVQGEVNPLAGRLTPVGEGSMAGNAWELYTDPDEAAAWNYGYLASSPGPRVMTEEQFNTDGMSMRVTLDYYFGGADTKAAYRNPGA